MWRSRIFSGLQLRRHKNFRLIYAGCVSKKRSRYWYCCQKKSQLSKQSVIKCAENLRTENRVHVWLNTESLLFLLVCDITIVVRHLRQRNYVQKNEWMDTNDYIEFELTQMFETLWIEEYFKSIRVNIRRENKFNLTKAVNAQRKTKARIQLVHSIVRAENENKG